MCWGVPRLSSQPLTMGWGHPPDMAAFAFCVLKPVTSHEASREQHSRARGGEGLGAGCRTHRSLSTLWEAGRHCASPPGSPSWLCPPTLCVLHFRPSFRR